MIENGGHGSGDDATGGTAWADIADRVQTGDLLFGHGSETSSRAIEIITDSPYSHVAMIVRLGADRVPYVWEEAPQALGPDPVEGNHAHGGAQLGPAEEIIGQFYRWHDAAYWRPLVWERPANFDDQVAALLPPLEGIPFTDQKAMIERWIAGRLHIRLPPTEMFCAELVALTFQRLGLLPPDPPPNWYAPGSFGGTPPQAKFRDGIQLGEAVLVARPDVVIDLTKEEAAPRTAGHVAATAPAGRTT
jgi:hypothetical protein